MLRRRASGHAFALDPPDRRRFKQCRDAADTFVIQVGHCVSPVVAGRRTIAVGEAVADEQHAGVGAGLGGEHQEQQGELKWECLAQGDFHRF